MDIAAWLRSLGLERYAEAFRANDIDADILPELTAEDLAALGVTSVGHRRRLLAAIAALRNATPPVADSPATIRSEPVALPAVSAAAAAERRQLTVMFCDLVGSTALLSRLGQERSNEVRRDHFSALRDAVDELGSVLRALAVASRRSPRPRP